MTMFESKTIRGALAAKKVSSEPGAPRASDNLAWPSLADPAHGSQRLFRQILGALSEPGTLQTVDLPPPPQLGAALWGALLTLCDLDTCVWIAPPLDTPALREALVFHTGARLTDDPASADFALLTPATFSDDLAFAQGSDSYPDRSTTLLVVVERLSNAGGWTLSGPGIETTRQLDIGADDASQALIRRLAANRAVFPRGLDAIFGAGDRLAAIPRSTRIEHEKHEENR